MTIGTGIGSRRATRLTAIAGAMVTGAFALVTVVTAGGAEAQSAAVVVSGDHLRAQHGPGQVGRLSGSLASVVSETRAAGEAAGTRAARSMGLTGQGGRLRVIVSGAGAREAVAKAGAVVEARVGDEVQALVRASSLAGISDSSDVDLVRAPARFEPMAVVSQGVAPSGASELQGLGLTGAGVKIAIIDVGFNGYDALRGTELPSSVTAQDFCGGALTTATPHGTAVAELIHDVAPAAELLLACVNSELTLNQAEQWAVAQGARIINHSVGWFNTSGGDGSGGPGTPDGAVAHAEANGVLWVNAAGNEAENHWGGSGADSNENGWVQFTSLGDEENRITVGAGQRVCADLKWNAWPVTSNDYDLYLTRQSDGALLAASAADQASGPLPPTEALCWTNSGSSAVGAGIRIDAYAADVSTRLDLFVTAPLQYGAGTEYGSVVEPATSPAALTVGAVCYQPMAPDYDALEAYSSRGRTVDGREKPDIVAYDSVSTVTYGPGTTCGATGFAGTSAAAGYVSGAAALLMESSPALSATAIRAQLERQAVDIETDGRDALTGWGRVRVTARPSARELAHETRNGRIRLINGNGTYPTTASGQDALVGRNPDWSPNGVDLAYEAGSSVVIRSTVSGAFALLPGTASDPAFSPDGTALAVSRNGDIVRMETSGANAQTIISSSGTDTSPSWSSAGQLLFVSNRDGNREIYRANADGSSQQRLTTDAGDDSAPVWSPDGTKIAFTSNRDGILKIWVMNADGTSPVTISAPSTAGDSDPDWSPEGKIAYTTLENAQPALAVMNADGTGSYRVASGGSGRWRPGATMPATMIGPPFADRAEGRVGTPVRHDLGQWTGETPIALGVQWQRCAVDGTGCSDLAGATQGSYVPVTADAGLVLRGRVTATGPSGSVVATSPATVLVHPLPPVLQSVPTLTGSPVVGGTLTMQSGTWSPAPTGVQASWYRCAADGGTCRHLVLGDGLAYTVGAADVGYRIRALVRAWNDPSSASTAMSSPSAVIGAGGGGGGGGGGGDGGGGGGNLPDLQVVQTADRASAAVGDQILFRMDASMKNPTQSSGASNLVLTDALPANVDFVSVRTNRGSCSGGRTVVCNLSAINGLLVATVELVVRVAGTGEIANTATLRADETDPDLTNNTSTARVNAPTPVIPAPKPSPSPTPAPKPKPLGVTRKGSAKGEILRGTPFADALDGRAGADTLLGLAGNDRLTGGAGSDTLDGAAGDDTIAARDGAKDRVRCGAGKDIVTADKGDVVAKDCETVRRA